jgi:hypothetical protein
LSDRPKLLVFITDTDLRHSVADMNNRESLGNSETGAVEKNLLSLKEFSMNWSTVCEFKT